MCTDSQMLRNILYLCTWMLNPTELNLKDNKYTKYISVIKTETNSHFFNFPISLLSYFPKSAGSYTSMLLSEWVQWWKFIKKNGKSTRSSGKKGENIAIVIGLIGFCLVNFTFVLNHYENCKCLLIEDFFCRWIRVSDTL